MSTQVLKRLEADLGEFIGRRGGQPRDFSQYNDDPAGFIVDVLGGSPWTRQIEIAEAVRDHPFVVVPGCNSSGKDWLAARLALWWVFCRNGFVIITGPTQRQVQQIVMGEVARAWRRARDLGGELFQMALRIDGAEEQQGILALTSTEASKLTGFHAPRLLTILTEAQAVESWAWEGLLACRTGEHDRTLAVGNPLSPEGRFYQVSESAHWHNIRIPATDHPNVVEKKTIIPGGPTRTWIRSVEREYGRDSPIYVGRVEARFPAQGEDVLLEKRHVDAAVERFSTRDLEADALHEPYILGLDPAGPGKDASVLCIRQAGIVREFKSWRKLEAPELAEKVESVVRGILNVGPVCDGAYPGPGVKCAYVDEIGVGHGVAGILKRRLPHLRYWITRRSLYNPMGRVSVRAEGVNVGKTPGDAGRFVRRKDELLWALREELVEGTIALPHEERLIEELLAMRMIQTADGRMTSEPKDSLKGRLGRSPDHLDALMLTLHGSVRGSGKRRVAFV